MNAHARTVQHRFGAEAGNWSGLYGQNPSGSIYVHNLHRRKERALHLLKGVRGRILEIGCGAGNVILSLPREEGTQIFGSDFSPFMLRQATENASSKHSNLPLAAADACRLPYRPGTFQAILCLGVLDYIANYRLVLSECYRILAPGGRFVLSVPNITSPFVRLDDLGFQLKNRLTHSLPAGLRTFLKTRILGREDKPYFNHRKHRFHPQTVAAHLQTAGFQLDQTHYHTYGFGLLNGAAFNVGLSRHIESRPRRSKTLERFGWTCILSATKSKRLSP